MIAVLIASMLFSPALVGIGLAIFQVEQNYY